MSTMVSSATVDNKPIKCTLTRIIDDFRNPEEYRYQDTNIVKNYVYNPQKRLIA